MTALFGGAEHSFEISGSAFLNRVLGFFIIASVVFLLIGFLTPPAAFIALAGGVFSLVCSQNSITVEIYAVVLAAAIMLLGPGAFSLDARLFGRREIVIPKLGRNE